MTRPGARKGALFATVPVALLLLIALFAGSGREPKDEAQVAAEHPSSTIGTVAVDTNPTTTDQPSAEPMPSAPDGITATVAEVIDGDTIDVRLDEGDLDTVRLIGINAPETGECFSAQSTTALADLVGGKEIVLVKDVSERGQYGRLLRYVFVDDDVFVNAAIVHDGYAIARDYPPDVARSGELAAAQQVAETSRVGIWSDEACGARSDADVTISNIEYDAPGNDNEALDQEWVEITNHGDTPIGLENWVLRDESATYRYEFPAGFTLDAGASVRLITGCGPDSPSTLHWCNAGAVWNNDGDTAFLLDPNGNIHDSYGYD